MGSLKKVRVQTLLEKKQAGEKIVAITAYDYPTALLVDEAGVDMVLVGDSVGNVVLGYESTLPVTVEEMRHHVRAVRRGIKKALLVADMPFLSYQASIAHAIENAGLFLKDGAEAVKLEGGHANHRPNCSRFGRCGHSRRGAFGLHAPVGSPIWRRSGAGSAKRRSEAPH